ncbi:putative tail fibre protein [Mycolicibacterium canariasense]|uniref:Putative tail fibre protein n=1 Tax=Mycolicibacterium canariasense TaxID=228230 RepID=A0A117IAG9_MYCCR|nr:hypothetical protein [Mycolicibacterium canariasense]MCV7209955.1 hypothetical protein [Mycolicibacterium canariasense]ORV05222.1 hypothetical protein AWB94_20795 [Mycolicibacterium canariasense]GAS96363.1 putative tail fibre protein [Mycolicibacterium canariasense]
MADLQKRVCAVVGGGAVVVALLIEIIGGGGPSATVAGGSGDSSTTGTYSSPTVPAMLINPTAAMKLGSTATAQVPESMPATTFAAPTYKATAAPTCVNNGQCP